MPKPVKEEQLRDATMGPELLLRPDFEVGEAKGFSFFGKVKLAKEAINPNVDGKRVPAAIGVKKNAARDFGADTRQGLESGGGLSGGK